MKIAFKNSKILMINGRTLTPVPGQGPEPGLHYVYTSSEGHGSISASPMSGKKDTLITLSNTPDQNYIFSKYTLNNVDIAGSSFLMPDEDAYVRGYFEQNIFNISVSQVAGGTITAPESAVKGSTVNLSYTVQSGYTFKYFTVNGTQISGSSFIMPASNVVVSAYYEVLDYVQIGTQIWKKANLSVNDGQGGIIVRNGKTYYTLAAATRIANSISGWRLPTNSDFDTLKASAGSNAAQQKSRLIAPNQSGWTYDSANTTHFDAIPSGYYVNTGSEYSYNTSDVMLLSSTTSSTATIYAFWMRQSIDSVTNRSIYQPTGQIFTPVRLIKD